MPMTGYPASASLLLGAAAALGFAPLQLWPLTLLAFAWWLLLVHDAPTLRSALWRGWLFGVGHFSINNNWIQHAFTYQDEMPHWLGYLAPVALALYLAVYPMLAAGLAWRLASPRAVGDGATRPGAPFALVAGAAWIATEWLRGTMFTGYAWDPLGTMWLPVIGVARLSAWIGTYALSGVTIVAAASLLLLAQRRWTMPAVTTASLAFAAIGLSGSRSIFVSADHPRVRVVQPNIGIEARAIPGHQDRMVDRLAALSGRAGGAPRLIVWPEGAVDHYVEDGYPADYYRGGQPAQVRARLAQHLGLRDALLIGGNALAFDRDGALVGAGNSVFGLDALARITGRYDKAHLVPYGEYLPMRAILEPIGLSRILPGKIDFLPGPGPRAIELPGFGAVGVQVCYEIIFSGEVVDPARRPAMLFNPSNDAWFGAWGPPQHLAQARMRAIEEGLPVLRSTPNGISAIIAADGRLLASVPRHVAGAVELPVPPALPPTLFARGGNWLAVAVAAAMLILAVALRRRHR